MAEEETPMEDVQVEQQEDETPQHGGIQQLYSEAKLPYVVGFVAAIVLLVALVSGDGQKDHKYYKYGVSVAAVAMFFSLVGWALAFKGLVDSSIIKVNNVFLFVWNFVGACFLTFEGPFETTSNGYFASWFMVIASLMGLGVTANQVKDQDSGTGSLLGLFASSVIVITAIASKGFDEKKGDLIYTIIVACLSIVIALFLFRTEQAGEGQSIYTFPVLAFFALLWIVAASLVTFRGPFTETGNGYFGSWGGAVTSVFAAMAARTTE